MGWYDLLVTYPHSTGNGVIHAVWGWSRNDAINRARAAGFVVLAKR